MVFSSVLFIFRFLPIAMILYFLCNEYDLIKKLNQPETEGGKEME